MPGPPKVPEAFTHPAAVTWTHPPAVQHAPVTQGVGEQSAPAMNVPEHAPEFSTAAHAPANEQQAPPQGLDGVQVAPTLVKVFGLTHPVEDETAHAPVVVEQQAPSTLPAPELQNVPDVQARPEEYPTPTPENRLVPAHPAGVVAVHTPLVAQQAPMRAGDWQKVVGAHEPEVTPMPVPRNVALPVHPAAMVALHVPVAEQHAPMEGVQ